MKRVGQSNDLDFGRSMKREAVHQWLSTVVNTKHSSFHLIQAYRWEILKPRSWPYLSCKYEGYRSQQLKFVPWNTMSIHYPERNIVMKTYQKPIFQIPIEARELDLGHQREQSKLFVSQQDDRRGDGSLERKFGMIDEGQLKLVHRNAVAVHSSRRAFRVL